MSCLLCGSKKQAEFSAEILNGSRVALRIKKKDTVTTHRVQEHELLQRLERLCEAAGLEFPKEAWPKDDRKAYFLLGVCATEDMKGLTLRERLERLDDWARQRNLLRPNETLFAKKQVKAQQPTILLKTPHVRQSNSREWMPRIMADGGSGSCSRLGSSPVLRRSLSIPKPTKQRLPVR